MLKHSMISLFSFLVLVGCSVSRQEPTAEINNSALELVSADVESIEVTEEVLDQINEQSSEGLDELVEPMNALSPAEIPDRSLVDTGWVGATSRLYRATFPELNGALGAVILRDGEYNQFTTLYITAAAGRICRRLGWTGGGDPEWINLGRRGAVTGQVTFACFHGQIRWVPGYAFATVGSRMVDGRNYGADHALFTASGAARLARNLGGGAFGGLLQEYGGGAAVISLLFSGRNVGVNVEWGRTYGIIFRNNDPFRYLHLEHFAGTLCRANYGSPFGRVTELNGATGAATLQCGN